MTISSFIIIFFIGGWALSKVFIRLHLPGILGMVFYGIFLKVFFKDIIPEVIWEVEPFLKSLALVVILLRAGLGIRRKTLQKVGKTAFLMSFIPCFIEALGLSFIFRFFFGFGWGISGLFAFILSAVSPAVVVPSMLDLKQKGIGKRNDLPTMILASASADDVIAITGFSLFLTFVTGHAQSVTKTLLFMPLSIIIGILMGLGVGLFLTDYFVRKYHNVRATEKTLLLLMMGLFVVEAGNLFHVAAFLGVMTVGFVILERAERVAHEVADKLSKIWVVAEIILFVLIGMAVDPRVAMEVGFKGVLVVFAGLLFRSFGVLIATAFDRNLSWKERGFCIMAFLPKATVQAALGSIPLAAGVPGGSIILSLSVLAILLTAPLGVFLIHKYGEAFLE